MLSLALRLAAYLTIAWCTVAAWLYFQQRKLLFPAPQSYSVASPSAAGLTFEDLKIPVTANAYVHAWWIPSPNLPAPTVLMFHGNGYRLEDMAAEEAGNLHATGANLLLVDYRGYGLSSPASTSESTVNEDARTSLKYLENTRRIPANTIFLLGRSIGSGPATTLALENPRLAGLILESPFTSIANAADRLWFARLFPIRLMLKTHFDNLAKIPSVRIPILIACGTADDLTPLSMARELFAKANDPKELYLVNGAGHNDLLYVGGNALTTRLRRFMSARAQSMKS